MGEGIIKVLLIPDPTQAPPFCQAFACHPSAFRLNCWPHTTNMADAQNIHLFFGEDQFQLRKKLQLWKSEFKKKYDGDLNLIELEAKETTANGIIEALETVPFLAEKKLVIINNFLAKGKEHDQEKILEYLANPLPDHAILLFFEEASPDKRRSFYKKLQKLGKLHNFSFMKPDEMARFLHETSKGALSLNSAKYLINQTGAELWRSEKELEKLLVYADDQKITDEMIDEMVMPTLSSTIFKLTDQIAEKNSKGAMKTLNILIESGEDPYRILFMIVRQFRIILQVKDLLQQKYDMTHIIKTLKLHPYVASTTIKQSRNFEMEELKRIYKALLHIDVGIKTGEIKMSVDYKIDFCLSLERIFLQKHLT